MSILTTASCFVETSRVVGACGSSNSVDFENASHLDIQFKFEFSIQTPDLGARNSRIACERTSGSELWEDVTTGLTLFRSVKFDTARTLTFRRRPRFGQTPRLKLVTSAHRAELHVVAELVDSSDRSTSHRAQSVHSTHPKHFLCEEHELRERAIHKHGLRSAAETSIVRVNPNLQ